MQRTTCPHDPPEELLGNNTAERRGYQHQHASLREYLLKVTVLINDDANYSTAARIRRYWDIASPSRCYRLLWAIAIHG